MIDKRALRFWTAQDLAWPILAFLNAKYAIEVDARFFYNIRSVDDHRSFRPSDLQLLRNPFHVVPRAFFARRVQPPLHIGVSGNALPRYAGDAEPGTTAADGQPYPAEPVVTLDGTVLPIDPERVSIVSGLNGARESGDESNLSVDFRGDIVIARMDAAQQKRFLVLNEIYHPDWRATADGRHLKIFKTNTLMRGVIVPKGTTTVVFTFVPFLATKWALAIFLCGIASGVAAAWYFGRRAGSDTHFERAAHANR